jgi:beta-N-acetylhexosaminidase
VIVVLNAANAGYAQFIGPQGWAFVIWGPANTNDSNPLAIIKKELNHNHSLTPGATAQPTPPLTPQQFINLVVQHMTLDQKLGQMMIVQFVGPTYSLDISTMISQYHVGAVLLFTVNNNIVDKAQLKELIQQMQSNSSIPLVVAIDQEGGTVDRLKSLDGPRPPAAEIGATNDPGKAMAAGIQDAQDLASYGFNLNLAPVVDVTNVYNPQLYDRTYSNNAAQVTKMAQAYLQGLQQSGKVLGTIKHFPGLGDVGVDPHSGVPNLYRSKSDLEAIDWAPYRALIQQGNVHAIMVTHEIVHSIDSSLPSSLSYKVVTGILRNDLGFQGVIMTDSLTMEGITAYYPEDQAAAVAVEAGSDLLMGATTPSDVASMIEGIKQAMASGAISQQRIDDSVRRILMLKYQMGLLPIPTN